MVHIEEWRLIPDSDGYRLPIEAEWEYASRSGTVTQYSFGDEEGLASRFAVYGTNRTKICGSKLPNSWGLFDLHGNVMEWCQDWLGPDGSEEAVSDPVGSAIDKQWFRIIRGGYFNIGTLGITSSRREYSPFSNRVSHCGFRVARTVTPSEPGLTQSIDDCLHRSSLISQPATHLKTIRQILAYPAHARALGN
jgi:formylglycine-generating enzyme required for sulfatase activity